MKHYRIVRRTKKFLNFRRLGGQEKTEVLKKVWYVAQQRFLWIFWFRIGHELEDCILFKCVIEHRASTRQEMEEYLSGWHEIHYGNEKYKVEYE